MRHAGITAVLVALAVTGCAKDSDDANVAADVELWEEELPIRDPWLRESLPDDVLMYMRLPNLFGLFAMPKGNVLDEALRSRANVENVQKIRAGIVDNVLQEIPAIANPQLVLFERHVQSPVEIAGSFLPVPSALVAVTLDLNDNADFEAFVAELGFSLDASLDAEGSAELLGIGMPAFVNFDAATGRLLVNAGPGANEQNFPGLVAELDRSTQHPMRSMEDQVDASGQGIFVWMNAQEALPAMQMFVPIDQYQQMLDVGLDKVDAVGIGWGVANDKSRLAIVADVTRDRELLPTINNALSARSVGEPDALMLVSLPRAEELRRLAEAPVLRGEDGGEDWDAVNDMVRELAGVTMDEIFSAIGPEALVLFDGAGDYMAIQIRDRALFDDVLARVGETTGSAPDQRERNGKTYYYWSMPNEVGMMGDAAAGELGAFGEIVGRLRDHYYWIYDGDYAYVASTPQVLFDRVALGADTDVGDWLENTQRIEGSDALFSFSGTTRKLPMRLYAAYIEILQLLADLAAADIDVWSMPTATELGLPERGTVGLTVSIGEPTLAMELTFENNPVEMMGGLAGPAVVGILAAIAIPAYQDYTIRAQVAEGLNISSSPKAQVAEFYATQGRFPNAEEAASLSQTAPVGEYARSIEIEADTGVIFVDYAESVGGGGRLFLEPMAESGRLTWICYGTFEDKHLPAACRQ